MAGKFDLFLDLILQKYWHRARGQQASSLFGFTKEAWGKQRKEWGAIAKGLQDQLARPRLTRQDRDGVEARIAWLESAVQWSYREYLRQYIFRDLGLLEKIFWRYYSEGIEPQQHELGDVLHSGQTPVGWHVSAEEFQENRDRLSKAWSEGTRRIELLERRIPSDDLAQLKAPCHSKEHRELGTTVSVKRPIPQVKINAALEVGNRKTAVSLWQEDRKAAGKKATKTALYKHAHKDKKEFYAWWNGQRPNDSAADQDIRRALTTVWD